MRGEREGGGSPLWVQVLLGCCLPWPRQRRGGGGELLKKQLDEARALPGHFFM